MKGLWVLPTRRRLQKLQVFFDKAIENSISTPGVCLVQKDEFIELNKEYQDLKLPQGWSVLPTNSDGFGDKFKEVWPSIKQADWLGIACDDLRIQTPEFDKILLDNINGKNIVTCNDGIQGPTRMSGITIFSGPLMRAMGYLFPSDFWHTFVDNVWEDIGKETQCWTYVPDVLITHDHPFVNQKIDPEKADETTYKSYGQQARDKAAYIRWKDSEFKSVCERIKAL